MKIKLMIMAFLVMVAALSPFPRAKATGLCPPSNCYDPTEGSAGSPVRGPGPFSSETSPRRRR